MHAWEADGWAMQRQRSSRALVLSEEAADGMAATSEAYMPP
jgi:hypothetical protein